MIAETSIFFIIERIEWGNWIDVKVGREVIYRLNNRIIDDDRRLNGRHHRLKNGYRRQMNRTQMM
ncbi:MAG: hypothetical protein K2J42_00690, partial [Muribaculaceae bacterium]|nr:hypothetical protein [Muribaculaceae bacterium]